MILGIVFHNYLSKWGYLTPYLIFLMLFITYSKISLKDLSISRLHCYLLAFQIIGSIGIFLLIRPFNLTLAQGIMICVFAPTASASVVVTKMLGGNIAGLTTYNLLSNFTVAVLTPIVFTFISDTEINFIDSSFKIASRVIPLVIFPFFAALFVRKFFPSLNRKIEGLQSLSFYLWSIALTIVVAKVFGLVFSNSIESLYITIIMLIAALVICLIQFVIGRYLGRKYKDTIAGGQALGQKNTILAIWMAQTYLNPAASLAPGAYVLWQNLVNSYQLSKMKRNK